MAYDTGARDHPADQALARFHPRSQPVVLADLRLRARAEAARTARRWMAEVAAEWNISHVTDDLQLCTSELVTNVHLHAPGPPGSTLRLRAVRQGARLRVEVHDGDHAVPVRRRAAPGDLNGRGLFLVAQVADEHGSYPTRTGKAVWFTLTAWRCTGPSA